MTQANSHPAWKREGDTRVSLSGSWDLLLDAQRRKRLLRELGELNLPEGCQWDMSEVQALDSTGALVLWKIWGGRLPQQLDCDDNQLHWFKRLEATPPLPQRSVSMPMRLLERFGGRIVSVLSVASGILILVGQLMLDTAYCVRHPRVIPWREISANIYRVGATSMLLLGCVGFLIGVVMTIQLGVALQQFGASHMVIGLMATAVPRELGPVITGLIMAGRSGSAMTASIGAMHITEEYDALRAFGASPTLRLALPRVIGAAIAMPLLVVWADCTALVGGALIGQANFGVNFSMFMAQLPQQIQVVNFWMGVGKGALFGLTIALVGCYFGLTSSADTESMSRNTTLSVVTSLTLILLFDASLGAMLTHVGLL